MLTIPVEMMEKTHLASSFNPDEDGKEGEIDTFLCLEKYLQGGWQNRLILALRSNLPNEADWAFNKLIKLSFMHFFFVGYLPGLYDHCDIYH
jgi:hypothetical protein